MIVRDLLTLDSACVEPWFQRSENPHVWVADCRQWDAESLAANLSRRERLRSERFHNDLHRSRFVIRHGLLRRLLAKYTGVSEIQVVIETTREGRPFVPSDANPLDIEFSLSRSQDLCLYAISRGIRVGIDMEYVDCQFDRSSMIAWCCTASEVRWLAAMPAEMQCEHFYRLWTCKEACLKSAGVGLGVSPALVAVVSDADNSMGTGQLGNSSWSLCLFHPAARFVAALATPRSQ